MQPDSRDPEGQSPSSSAGSVSVAKVRAGIPGDPEVSLAGLSQPVMEGLPLQSVPLSPSIRLVTVLVSASPEAGSEINIPAQIAYVGSGPRKHNGTLGK